MHAYERNLITLIEDQTQTDSLRQIVRTIGESTLKTKQNETLTCERTLNKLYEYESVLTNIRNTVLNDLLHQFMKDIKEFMDRRHSMWVLINSISSIKKENKEPLKLKKKNRMYTSTECRPLPKIQRKYTTR
jgi:glutamyl-tRNA reductase